MNVCHKRIGDKHYCSKCDKWKHTDRFYKAADQSCGFSRVCTKCCLRDKKRHRETNPHVGKRTWIRLIAGYNLTETDYTRQFERQDKLCALCLKPSSNGKRLAVDHDHAHHVNEKQACKECIRGLLCDGCNRFALPILERNPILQNDRVQEYLRQRPFADVLQNIPVTEYDANVSLIESTHAEPPCREFHLSARV